jgi:hypothetical protein
MTHCGKGKHCKCKGHKRKGRCAKCGNKPCTCARKARKPSPGQLAQRKKFELYSNATKALWMEEEAKKRWRYLVKNPEVALKIIAKK